MSKDSDKLTFLRNKFANELPTGEIKAWDLIVTIQEHLTLLDELIDYLKIKEANEDRIN